MLETLVSLLSLVTCYVLVGALKAFQLWEYYKLICRYFEICQNMICESFSTGISRDVVMCDHARLARNSRPAI